MKLAPQYSASGTNSMLNFFTGALDVAYMGSSPLVLGHVYALPMRLVSVACAHRGSLAVVSRHGDRVTDGPRIGTVLGSDGHVLAHFYGQDHDVKRPVYINLSPEECLGALKSGMIDYAALWEPYVSLAVEGGAKVVFTDNDLPFSMYSFLVATDRAVQDKGASVSAVAAAHSDALAILRSDYGMFSDRLRMVFGSEVSARSYERILAEKYEWDAGDLLNDSELPAGIRECLTHVQAAHEALQSTTFAARPFDALVGSGGEPRGNVSTAPLMLGYSNSIMCTSFHIADYANEFQRHGFEVQSGRRRIADRIARLESQVQDDLRLCHELLARDPELVVQKIGHMNEQLFRTLSRNLLGTEPRTVAAVIESLREAGVIPPDILSWADSIRSIRNVIAHGDQPIREDEAANVFSIMLNILEWHMAAQTQLASAPSKCGRCKSTVDPTWIACPTCGSSLSDECKGCGHSMESTWKVCPFCGVSTKD